MPKNSKNQQSNGASAAEPSAAEVTPQSKKRSKPSAKTTAPKTVAKKSVAKAATTKTPARETARKRTGYEPSDEEIRIRAYFIAERRAQMSLEGDPANDWLEARKQLREEAAQRKAADG